MVSASTMFIRLSIFMFKISNLSLYICFKKSFLPASKMYFRIAGIWLEWLSRFILKSYVTLSGILCVRSYSLIKAICSSSRIKALGCKFVRFENYIHAHFTLYVKCKSKIIFTLKCSQMLSIAFYILTRESIFNI